MVRFNKFFILRSLPPMASFAQPLRPRKQGLDKWIKAPIFLRTKWTASCFWLHLNQRCPMAQTRSMQKARDERRYGAWRNRATTGTRGNRLDGLSAEKT